MKPVCPRVDPKASGRPKSTLLNNFGFGFMAQVEILSIKGARVILALFWNFPKQKIACNTWKRLVLESILRRQVDLNWPLECGFLSGNAALKIVRPPKTWKSNYNDIISLSYIFRWNGTILTMDMVSIILISTTVQNTKSTSPFTTLNQSTNQSLITDYIA